MKMTHDTDKLQPAPGPSYIFEVNGTSNYPIQEIKYKVDMYDQTVFMVYQNAAFTSLTAVMAKLGHIFGKYDITGDIETANAKVEELANAINAIST